MEFLSDSYSSYSVFDAAAFHCGSEYSCCCMFFHGTRDSSRPLENVF